MHKAWLAAVLLAAGLLAGCATKTTAPAVVPPTQADYLSPPIYAIKPPQEVWVPSSVDGKRMDNALYLPDVPAGTRVPVYIIFSPYWGDSMMDEGRDGVGEFPHFLLHRLVPRGYALVFSAIRGTGHSEGCFQIGGDVELKDTRDVIDHFAGQPWSNGNVGAGGKSYRATTQNGVIAKFPTPHLKTIFDVEGITDMYRYNGKDGVTYANGLTFNTLYYAGQSADEYGVAGNGAASPNDESSASLARLADKAGCPEAAKEQASGVGTAADGLKDAYWQERDWVHFLPQSNWTGSVFYEQGFQDWNVKPDDMEGWLQELKAHGNQVLGWLHQWTQDPEGGHVYPMRTDWNTTLLRWLDHYLKGVDNGIDRELGFDLQGSDKAWRHADAWPPAGTPTQASADLATGGGIEFAKAQHALRVSGTPWLRVTATSMSADPILYARLLDVAPDGSTVQVNEAARRGLLSDDLTSLQPWPPGTAKTFNLTFYPMDLVLQPGHRLVAFPGLPPLAQTGPMGAASTGPDGNAGFVITAAQGQVSYGAATAGFTVTSTSLGLLDPQPTPMKCFAC